MRIARDTAAGKCEDKECTNSCTYSGIMHLHKEGILHRFITTANILVGEGFRGYVSNFGFSHFKPKTQSYAQTYSNNIGEYSLRMVAAHTLSVGPITSMSPEAITEKKYSEGSDAWYILAKAVLHVAYCFVHRSFGVLLWVRRTDISCLCD